MCRTLSYITTTSIIAITSVRFTCVRAIVRAILSLPVFTIEWQLAIGIAIQLVNLDARTILGLRL